MPVPFPARRTTSWPARAKQSRAGPPVARPAPAQRVRSPRLKIFFPCDRFPADPHQKNRSPPGLNEGRRTYPGKPLADPRRCGTAPGTRPPAPFLSTLFSRVWTGQAPSRPRVTPKPFSCRSPGHAGTPPVMPGQALVGAVDRIWMDWNIHGFVWAHGRTLKKKSGNFKVFDALRAVVDWHRVGELWGIPFGGPRRHPAA